MAADGPLNRSSRSRASLAVVYLTVFIDLLGFGIILPVLPYYAERLGASGLWLGALLSSYSLAQLVGAAVLGRLSDRFGRRPILVLSLTGSAVSLALTGLATALVPLAAARALAGLFGGSISAAHAYIADVTAPGERARFMGYLGAAIGAGFVLGPAIGALLSRFGFGAAAFTAAGLAALNCLFALWRLRESRPQGERTAIGRRPWRRLRVAVGRPALARVLAATFLTMLSFVALETTLAYLGEVRFGLDERGFGLLLVIMGIVVVGVQGGLTGPLSERFGERRLSVAGCVVMGITLALIPLCRSFAAAALVLAVMAAGRALTLPTLSALISRHATTQEQGGTLGLGQSLQAAARAAGPVAAGGLYDLAMSAPYLLAAAVSLVAALVVGGAGEPADAGSAGFREEM